MKKIILLIILLLFFSGCGSSNNFVFITKNSSSINGSNISIGPNSFVNTTGLINNYITISNGNKSIINGPMYFSNTTAIIDYIKANNILLDTYYNYNTTGDLLSYIKVYDNNNNITTHLYYYPDGRINYFTKVFKNKIQISTINYAIDNMTINSIIVT